MKIKRLDHVGIRVMNFDRAINFYEKLDFVVTRQDSKERVVVLKHDSGIEIDSAEGAKQHLESIGLVVTEGPVTFGDGKTSVFIRDPDRNVIEFSQLP
jgi:lactoylglutathione lyase